MKKFFTFSKAQLLVLKEYADAYSESRLLSIELLSDGLMKVTEIDFEFPDKIFYEYYSRAGKLVRSEYDDKCCYLANK